MLSPSSEPNTNGVGKPHEGQTMNANAQQNIWTYDGNSTLAFDEGSVIKTDVVTGKQETLIVPKDLIPQVAYSTHQ